ncbi:MAG TPA: dephospho-CoA kinase [Clostridiaceae bacterium]|nr:dephospho-CoA kinase [Clostridiaceae bacterium]
MFVIGITGGIGSGKTTVSNILSESGIKVISADQISRSVTAKDGIAIPELQETFGEEFIKDGALDRKLTAALVFRNRKALDLLNRIVHRHVLDQMGEELDRLEDKRVKAVALDVPIPVRQGFLDRCDVVFTVWADDEIRQKRLAKRGLSRSDALQRIAMQMSREEYREIAAAEIVNNGSIDDLRRQVEDVIGVQLRERGIRYKSFLAAPEATSEAESVQS